MKLFVMVALKWATNVRGYKVNEKRQNKINGIGSPRPRPVECSPHLPLLDLAANDLPPLLNDVDQDIALLQELALLAGRVHLREY